MPHNRTRLWVGMAIVAVTIPAVGTYYYGSATPALRGTPIAAAGRWDATSSPDDPGDLQQIAVRKSPRDYAAELDALLAKQGTSITPDPTVGSDDDPNFEVDAIGDEATETNAVPRSLPDPPPDLPPNATVTVDTNPEAAPAVASDVPTNLASTGELSDGDVYRLVTSNLSANDRDEFVRAYAAMTPDQRADLIDGFRDQMQRGNGR